MLNPNAAGLDLHKEEIWVCPGGFQDNHEPEVKTFGTLTGELRKLVAYLKEKKVTAVAMEATGIYWIPVFEMLKNEGFDTCLVNARNIKVAMDSCVRHSFLMETCRHCRVCGTVEERLLTILLVMRSA